MDFLSVDFAVSGVHVSAFVPPLVAMVVSFFMSMAGLSGAFLLLPFQMSALGYTSPSVSATNFVFNIVAIPSGVYRYMREGRMFWPVAIVTMIGTLPGVFIGYYVRVTWLPDPARFKFFVGCVLLYLAIRMLMEVIGKGKARDAVSGPLNLKVTSTGATRIHFSFAGAEYSFGTLPLLALSFAVGIVGGTYGIGGGAIISPFLVAVMGLPVYAVAGASLFGTLITSVVGVFFYSVIPSAYNTTPDWPLGLLFGAGGVVGMYLGARSQKHVPQRIIKAMLFLVLAGLALKYTLGGFIN